MTALQTVNLGTAPAGSDGDPVRTAFVKANSNVAVLQAQAALTTWGNFTVAGALTNVAVGKRININLASPGTVNLPAASTCAADSVILLRNTGTTIVTLAIASGSGDTLTLSKLNPGEAALMDTDGVHAWTVLMRGRTNSDNEVVNGNCTVNGNETVGGTLTAMQVGAKTSAGSIATISIDSTTSDAAILSFRSGGKPNFELFRTNDTARDLILNAMDDSGAWIGDVWRIARLTQTINFIKRPTFAGKTPWDNGNLVSPWSAANLANPATLDTAQTITGAKTFSAPALFNGQITVAANSSGGYTSSTINLSSPAVPGFGFNAGGFGATLAYAGGSPGSFQFMDFQRSGYYPIVCSTLTQASDSALKTDVVPQTGVLEKLRGKRTVLYTLKSDPGKTRHIGVVAQEWQADFPELVADTGADIDEDGDFIAHQYDEGGNEIFGPNGKPESRQALGFNYANASAVALQAAIELQDKLDAALKRIAALEAMSQ